jgi:hypothetical protein
MSDEQEHRDHALSRIYREGAWPEPGRQIDQAILVASRRAARERHPFLWRWAPSLAVAATVVLTSTLVLKVYREQPEVVAPGAFDKVEKAETRAKQPGPEPKAEAKAAPAPAQQPVTTPQGFSSTMDAGEAARLERAQQDIGFKDVTSPGAVQVPAKAAPAPKAQPALKKEAEPARTDRERRADAPQTPTIGPTVSVFGAQAPAAAPAAQTPPAPNQAARALGKPATQFQNAPQAPAPEPAQGQARLQAAPAEAALQPQASTRPEAMQAPITGASISTNALSADAIAARVDARSPQAWIEDIRKLMKEGKSEEAGQEIARFKKRYPDYVLPEDLR